MKANKDEQKFMITVFFTICFSLSKIIITVKWPNSKKKMCSVLRKSTFKMPVTKISTNNCIQQYFYLNFQILGKTKTFKHRKYNILLTAASYQ